MIQWCTHHKDDPPPPEDDENKEKRTDDIPVWDQEFLKVDQGTLFELILVNMRLFFRAPITWNFLAVRSLFIEVYFWHLVISPRKQEPEWRRKHQRDEATGQAVDFQEVKHESDCRDVCLIDDKQDRMPDKMIT